jgi:hypothetical protein
MFLAVVSIQTLVPVAQVLVQALVQVLAVLLLLVVVQIPRHLVEEHFYRIEEEALLWLVVVVILHRQLVIGFQVTDEMDLAYNQGEWVHNEDMVSNLLMCPRSDPNPDQYHTVYRLYWFLDRYLQHNIAKMFL